MSEPDYDVRGRRGVLSAIVVNYRAGQALRRCVESLLNRPDVDVRVIVVDNDPSDSDMVAADLTRDAPTIHRLVSGSNVGFAVAANRGLAAADGDWVALINPDTTAPPGSLGALVDVLRSCPDVAAVAPRLCLPDGTSQPYSYGDEPTPFYLARRIVARIFGHPLHDWGPGETRAVDWVSGACLVLRPSALEQIGPLDERFFLYFEDVDWCRRCRAAGWRIRFEPGVTVTHESRANYGDASRRRYYQESLLRYYRKYFGQAWVLALQLVIRSRILG